MGAVSRSFTTLLDEIAACRVCEADLPAGPRPVLQAHPSARILIAGQAPGRRVHESGVPFQDPSGERLRAWMGVSEDEFYDPEIVAIVPMGFCYPGTGSSGDLPPRPECAPLWRERVLTALSGIELTLVLGRYAMGYHLDVTRQTLTEVVKDWRARWPDVLPLPHPSPRNQRWLKKNGWFEAEVIPALQGRVAELLSTSRAAKQ